MLKKCIILSSMLILTSCYPPGTALLGPSITIATTGNIYQAGLSYGTSEAVYKITGKTSTENVKNFFNIGKNYDIFYKKVEKK